MEKLKTLAVTMACLFVFSSVAYGLVSLYVSGTTKSDDTVVQAIYVDSCSSAQGYCYVAPFDKLSWTWNMGDIYQGSVYTAVITLRNDGNQDITVDMLTTGITSEGGDGIFDGSVSYSPNTGIVVPAGGTVDITETVSIHPAEEPGTTFEITTEVVPSSS
jgi:hypothetical protein